MEHTRAHTYNSELAADAVAVIAAANSHEMSHKMISLCSRQSSKDFYCQPFSCTFQISIYVEITRIQM